MSRTVTFQKRSEPLPTLIASLVFLVPGGFGLVFGPLTFLGLTWVDNTANGLLITATCAVWALVGAAVLRFRRWVTVDGAGGVVERGTRTLFRHPAERFPVSRFAGVEVRAERIGDTAFYVAALRWNPGQRPASSTEPELWLHAWPELAPARAAAGRVAELTGLPLLDRTA